MESCVEQARHDAGDPIIWIPQILPKEDVITLYTHASVFVCPSVYEPFGIINLEAMACGTPVAASAVGGIPEIVVPGETGLLVPIETRGATDFEPMAPDTYARNLADAINRLLDNPSGLVEMGRKSRQRVEEKFCWKSIARETLDFYTDLVEGRA